MVSQYHMAAEVDKTTVMLKPLCGAKGFLLVGKWSGVTCEECKALQGYAKDGMPYGIGSDQWPGLAKLMEEMGELQQVLGKIMACEGTDAIYWDGTSLVPALTDEIADVTAALQFFIDQNLGHHSSKIRTRFGYKLGKFREWHRKYRTGK